jgi:DNA-3-methyladenine glycosylase
MIHPPLSNTFFDRDALTVAKDLIGKVLCSYVKNTWLTAMIIETEAYLLEDKASHASLGYTEKRKALFMPPGTIYMYYARGVDSLNFSVKGEGAAVLIKSGVPFINNESPKEMLDIMHQLNPKKDGTRREDMRLCSGQTLLCRALNLKVREWDQQALDPERFHIADVSYKPNKIIRATRLGIPEGRDEHLLYRFVDQRFSPFCTKNPEAKSQSFRTYSPMTN